MRQDVNGAAFARRPYPARIPPDAGFLPPPLLRPFHFPPSPFSLM